MVEKDFRWGLLLVTGRFQQDSMSKTVCSAVVLCRRSEHKLDFGT